MVNKFISQLVAKYKISNDSLFEQIVQMALKGEIKEDLIAYNLNQVLALDLNSAVDLANEIIFLPAQQKKELLTYFQSKKKAVDFDSEVSEIISRLNLSLDQAMRNRFKNSFLSY